MARYTGPRVRVSRRFGVPIFGASKYLERRNFPPGVHGPKFRRKVSEYGAGLIEKQKLRFFYGLQERQFRSVYERALRMRGVTGEKMLQILETRLDNVVFRLGYANSRSAARQLVSHGHVRIDGHKVDVASFTVAPGHEIEIRDRTSSKQLATRAIEEGQGRAAPAWLVTLPDQLKGQMVREPAKEELPRDINVQIIVEFYSR